MLRRKLLIMLALFTSLMLATAIAAVVLMRGVLEDLEHINSLAVIGTTASSSLSESMGQIEGELLGWTPGSEVDVDTLVDSVKSMEGQLVELGRYYDRNSGDVGPYLHLESVLSVLSKRVDMVVEPSIGQTDEQSGKHIDSALSVTIHMRQAIISHADFAFEHMKTEQSLVTARFRWMAISLAAIFVVLINVSIILLIRAASWVLRPVDRLIEASRHLAREEYDYRVEIGRKDEFDELAQGFNHLAEHMQKNEERKIEMLHQVARTLNHELNNAMAIIDLQLRMVTKSPGYDQASSQQLELIHETLNKMSQTVNALTQVRQVVLTDYIKGVKMLDLERSTKPKGDSDPEQSQQVSTP